MLKDILDIFADQKRPCIPQTCEKDSCPTKFFPPLKKKIVRPLGQVKKKHVSRPRPLHLLAPPLFFVIFYEQRFHEQKPTGVTCKVHCCCVHTKIM